MEYCRTHHLMCDVPGYCLDEGKGWVTCDPIDLDIPKLIAAAMEVVKIYDNPNKRYLVRRPIKKLRKALEGSNDKA